jgi:hypothetical protein
LIGIQKRYIIALILGTIVSGAVVIWYQSTDSYNPLDERYVQLKPGKVDNIVLLNFGDASRTEIAETITELGKCGPRLIVVDLLFREYSGDSSDAALIEALDEYRVLLPSKHGGQGTFAVHENFQEAAADIGFTDIRISQDGRDLVTDFNLYHDLDGKRDYHLAHKIVSRLDPVAANNFDMTVKSPTVDVVISKLSSQFRTLDYQKPISCDVVKDKLIIAGYLGPGEDYKLRTYATFRDDQEGNGKDMYGPVVLANQVLMMMGE